MPKYPNPMPVSTTGHILIGLKQWFANLSLSIVLKVVAGKANCTGIATADEEEEQRWHHALVEFLHILGVFTVADALPFLRWLDLGGHEKSMRRIAKELDTILSGWLEEHKRNSKSLSEKKVDRDFMDIMLSTINGKEMGGYDADTIVKATCLAIISGGTDIVMITLTWAVSLLLNNLPILKEAREELDAQIGKQRYVNESDIANLSYLHAIVKETLRLHPAGPIAVPHESTKDCLIDGHHVPKGTRLIFNLWKIQTDPRAWPESMEFKPERFFHKDVDVKDRNFKYLPFGGGRRICPGMSFGLQSVHSMLTRFLHAFEVSTLDDSPMNMLESFGITVDKVTPLEVMLAPRLQNEVYEFA